ncbi:hypothetical protein Tco_0851998 [Tanacetum coccineum]
MNSRPCVKGLRISMPSCVQQKLQAWKSLSLLERRLRESKETNKGRGTCPVQRGVSILNVQVMGSFDGWSHEEYLSAEYTKERGRTFADRLRLILRFLTILNTFPGLATPTTNSNANANFSL